MSPEAILQIHTQGRKATTYAAEELVAFDQQPQSDQGPLLAMPPNPVLIMFEGPALAAIFARLLDPSITPL